MLFALKLPRERGTPIPKQNGGDMPPFRAWFFVRSLINRVSNSMIFEDSL